MLTELPQAALFSKADAKVLLFHETAKLFYKKYGISTNIFGKIDNITLITETIPYYIYSSHITIILGCSIN